MQASVRLTCAASVPEIHNDGLPRIALSRISVCHTPYVMGLIDALLIRYNACALLLVEVHIG